MNKIERLFEEVIFSVLFVLIVTGSWALGQAQDKPPVKFGLSETELLKQQILTLRKQLLQCQLDSVSGTLNSDIQAFADTTIKAHGSPKNVKLDPSTMQFVITPETQDATNAKPKAATKSK